MFRDFVSVPMFQSRTSTYVNIRHHSNSVLCPFRNRIIRHQETKSSFPHFTQHTLLCDTVQCILCLILSRNVGIRRNTSSYFRICHHACQNTIVVSTELLVQRFMRPESLRIRQLQQAVVFFGMICISGVFAVSPLMSGVMVRLRWDRVMEGFVTTCVVGLSCQDLSLLGLV